MSDLVVFSVGMIIFAITVFGTIIGAGIALSRQEIAADPDLRKAVDKGKLDKIFPFKLKY